MGRRPALSDADQLGRREAVRVMTHERRRSDLKVEQELL